MRENIVDVKTTRRLVLFVFSLAFAQYANADSPATLNFDKKTLPSQSSFENLGGWQMQPATWIGNSSGGLLVERNKELVYFFMAGHPGRSQLHKLSTNHSVRGNSGTDPKAWPIATQLRQWDHGHTDTRCNFFTGRGVCRPNGKKLLTSSFSSYATDAKAFAGPWMSWIDETRGPTGALHVPAEVDRRSVFGGGFVSIPKWFADQYLDGRTFGVGHGGYHSGQGSSLGPSLFVAEQPQDEDESLRNPVVLLEFTTLNGDKSRMERRPGDYSNGLWGPEPDANGLGYFVDDILAGPVWIDTPTMTGLCYWAVQGIGKRDYGLQTLGASKQLRTRLYCYSAQTLADVANKKIAAYEARATISDWINPFDQTEDTVHYPCGAYWESKNQQLYIAYFNVGSDQYEPQPVVVVYNPK